MLVLFCMRGGGRIERRAFPAPSVYWAKGSCNPRAHRAARSRSLVLEIGATSLRGAKATKQSTLILRGNMDCFAEPVIGRIRATRWLAMTVAKTFSCATESFSG